MTPNPYLLAADNSPTLLPLLRSDRSLASKQDGHGYSLVHAAASYDHLDLLRALVREMGVPVDLRDEDGETALFMVETVAAAKVLVEELGLDPAIRGADGLTARERIEGEGEFHEVAEWLRRREADGAEVAAVDDAMRTLPPPPEGMSVRVVGAVPEADGEAGEPDPEFRRRIEELAANEGLDAEEAEARLRQLVQDIVAGQGLAGGDGRNVRRRGD